MFLSRRTLHCLPNLSCILHGSEGKCFENGDLTLFSIPSSAPDLPQGQTIRRHPCHPRWQQVVEFRLVGSELLIYLKCEEVCVVQVIALVTDFLIF